MEASAHSRMVLGLEAIIDAAAGILAEQSLEATLRAMARALHPIVPFTSLAVFSVDQRAGVLVPMLAEGRWVEETLASRPPLDSSISGLAVARGEVLVLGPDHHLIGEHQMAGTPVDE